MPGDNRPLFQRKIEAHVPQKILRDIWNRLTYGTAVPASDSCLFVVPRDVTHTLAKQGDPKKFRRQYSGAVRGGDWDLGRGAPVTENTKYVSCQMRWVDGAPWSSTPIYKKMLSEIAKGQAPDACNSPADVEARYAELDRVFEETQKRGRLLPKSELPNPFRREHGGILVHVTRDGTCLRSGGGAHRFAMAKILNLTEMPAQVGVVHRTAVASGLLQPMLEPRHGRAQ